MKQSYGPEAEKELRRTLLEFHEGLLVVGDKSKIPVTSLRQALAIGRARARRKEIETLSPKEWSTKPRSRDRQGAAEPPAP